MKTRILLVTLLIFIRRLTINGVTLEREDVEQIQRALYLLCENPSEAIRKVIDCVEQPKFGKYFGHWRVRPGGFGAVIFAKMLPTDGMTVKELTLPEDWDKRTEEIQVTPDPVTARAEVVIKVEFERIKKKFSAFKIPTMEVERLNAIRLAAWKVGPRVYEITVPQDRSAKDYVSFEEFIILEQINGWTFRKLFNHWIDEINKVVHTRSNGAVTLVRKLLNMQIVYMEGVKQIWAHGYRHCDASYENVMMRALPQEECEQRKKNERSEESATFDVIDDNCIELDKKHLVLIDPSFMVKVEDSSAEPACKDWATEPDFPQDLNQMLDIWFQSKEFLLRKFAHIKLISKMDETIENDPKVLSVIDEVETYTRIHNGLVKLRVEFDRRAKILEELKKWRMEFSAHARKFGGRIKIFGGRKGSRSVHGSGRKQQTSITSHVH